MLRLIIPVAFIFIFAGWILYHLLIAKDLNKNRNGLYAGLAFTALWALIYWWLL